MATIKERVLDHLRQVDDWRTPSDVAASLGENSSTVRRVCLRLKDAGAVEHQSGGVYRIVRPDREASTTPAVVTRRRRLLFGQGRRSK